MGHAPAGCGGLPGRLVLDDPADSPDRAFSRANSMVPHWKTREQETVFRHTLSDYEFYPKEKDSSGKWIVVRADLEGHITRCLLQHIREEREAAQEFRSRSLFERLHVWLGIAIADAINEAHLQSPPTPGSSRVRCHFRCAALRSAVV